MTGTCQNVRRQFSHATVSYNVEHRSSSEGRNLPGIEKSNSGAAGPDSASVEFTAETTLSAQKAGAASRTPGGGAAAWDWQGGAGRGDRGAGKIPVYCQGPALPSPPSWVKRRGIRPLACFRLALRPSTTGRTRRPLHAGRRSRPSLACARSAGGKSGPGWRRQALTASYRANQGPWKLLMRGSLAHQLRNWIRPGEESAVVSQ